MANVLPKPLRPFQNGLSGSIGILIRALSPSGKDLVGSRRAIIDGGSGRTKGPQYRPSIPSIPSHCRAYRAEADAGRDRTRIEFKTPKEGHSNRSKITLLYVGTIITILYSTILFTVLFT